jgi:biotin carboxyl carrier protein
VRDGVRAYLAVAGGIDVPVVLGSRSTFTRSALGGFDGRALGAGDRVPIGARAALAAARRRLPPDLMPVYGHAHDLRVLLGPQDDAFTAEGVATLCSAIYLVTAQSDRIGCRLSGPRIAHRRGADIVSDGTAFGSVQVTGDGAPIVLMADRGTTGGYTKIATVVGADLSKLAQATPGDRIRFVAVDLAQAHELARAQQRVLEAIGTRSAPGAAIPDEIYDEDSGAALAEDAYIRLADAIGAVPASNRLHGELVRAAMPGLVVDVMVAPGEAVTKRQLLLMIDAMQRQNPVRAPRAGRIARVLVERGAAVDAGTPLVAFETD